jgi:yeast amino acid transporter
MADIDLEGGKERTSFTASGTSPTAAHYDVGSTEHVPTTRWGRFTDSFKRNPNARVVTEAVDAEGKPLTDQPPAEPALSMELKNRHLQMIAIGGSIGTSYIQSS